MRMNKLPLAAFALLVVLPVWQPVHAQVQVQAVARSVPSSPAASRHYDGLVMEHRGDERGAFLAFQQAAEEGYAPAQRRLAEIYDSGNSVVARNYEEAIRWYQKAREGGEQIPAPRPRMPLMQ